MARESNVFGAAEGDGTTYYPTVEGMRAYNKLGASVGGDIGNDVYAFNELMSKPWTKRNYLREMDSSFTSDTRSSDPHIAARVWAMAETNKYISSNPEDNFYTIRNKWPGQFTFEDWDNR